MSIYIYMSKWEWTWDPIGLPTMTKLISITQKNGEWEKKGLSDFCNFIKGIEKFPRWTREGQA